MALRKHVHFHKPAERTYLIEDINNWIREVTKDPSDGLPENTRMTRHELETICRAIVYARVFMRENEGLELERAAQTKESPQ